MKHNMDALRVRQDMPLEMKIILSKQAIRAFNDRFPGQLYISNSGGVDSTVLAHIVNSILPHVPNVFVNTGLEFPENVDHVRGYAGLIELRPKKSFHQVIKEYGYPVVSKEIAQQIHEVRTTKSEKLRHKRLHGNGTKWKSGKIPECWKFLIDAPFKISDRCCYYSKKQPAMKYEKDTGRYRITGDMAFESMFRTQAWIRTGCNSFDAKRPSCKPLSFWTKTDIWEYIKRFATPYSKIYDKGAERTGCIYCMFGMHREKTDRFELLKRTHPDLYTYCMNQLGLREVIDYIKGDRD